MNVSYELNLDCVRCFKVCAVAWFSETKTGHIFCLCGFVLPLFGPEQGRRSCTLQWEKSRAEENKQDSPYLHFFLLVSVSIPKSHRLPGSYSLLPETQRHSDATRLCDANQINQQKGEHKPEEEPLKKKRLLVKLSRNDLLKVTCFSELFWNLKRIINLSL